MPIDANENSNSALLERVAQLLAHRACISAEHDPSNGKLHGYCVVCGVPWPCEYAGKPSPEAICECPQGPSGPAPDGNPDYCELCSGLIDTPETD